MEESSNDLKISEEVETMVEESWIRKQCHLQQFFCVNFQLVWTFNWCELSTGVNFQLVWTFNWCELSTGVNFQLVWTFNLCELSTGVNFQLVCTFNLCELSTCVNFQLVWTFNLCELSTGVNFQLVWTFNWCELSIGVNFCLFRYAILKSVVCFPFQDLDPGNLTSRFEIKKRALHNFTWYLEKVYPELGVPRRDGLAWGAVRRPDSTDGNFTMFLLAHDLL